MFMDREAAIHFIGGAVGGTAGTAITCPLEVVKTRMQSSRGLDTQSGPSTSSGNNSSTKSSPSSSSTKSSGFFKSVVSQRNGFGSNFRGGQFALERILHDGGFTAFSKSNIFNQFSNPATTSLVQYCVRNLSTSSTPSQSPPRRGTIVFRYIGQVIKTEGVGALYKGLIPNLIGVAPSKAVYFYTYSTSKRFWNDSEVLIPNSAIVHMVSAGSAGFVAASAVNPIWLVKTRLQLHQGHIGIWQMIKRVYKREGFKGFYKGVTASYAGVSETMIQFCIYEYFRGMLLSEANEMDKRKMDFLNFMVAGGSAKFIACVVAYPHEVVRTRLREETGASRGFFKTLYQLYKEGHRAMYRGLSVQLMRTVPNTAITMGTYEFVVYMLHHL
ncbi:hypothetical protein CAEBREN_11002 [Caenorhabditis brenneri]|uniref:Uncharacterized protein n=1 Tax=Caenorhabditis brenneri TaxID=135651 RepID=G0PIC8_CAEBE|nr:hypothetical protein CAEBREN_11002 [Caenorhabditis brenneri]